MLYKLECTIRHPVSSKQLRGELYRKERKNGMKWFVYKKRPTLKNSKSVCIRAIAVTSTTNIAEHSNSRQCSFGMNSVFRIFRNIAKEHETLSERRNGYSKENVNPAWLVFDTRSENSAAHANCFTQAVQRNRFPSWKLVLCSAATSGIGTGSRLLSSSCTRSAFVVILASWRHFI